MGETEFQESIGHFVAGPSDSRITSLNGSSRHEPHPIPLRRGGLLALIFHSEAGY
jgi:hypothetical protein